MNEIISRYSDKAVDRCDGLSNMECPLCGKVVFELDIEHYYEEGSDRHIECCNQCREDFEFEADVSLESDTIEPDIFDLFWTYGVESMQAKPTGNL